MESEQSWSELARREEEDGHQQASQELQALGPQVQPTPQLFEALILRRPGWRMSAQGTGRVTVLGVPFLPSHGAEGS